MDETKKSWIWLTIGLLVLASFVFNSSLRMAFTRNRMISDSQAELTSLSVQLTTLRQKIANLKTSPQIYEHLVRRELGYTRPGEKEIRFVKEEK